MRLRGRRRGCCQLVHVNAVVMVLKSVCSDDAWHAASHLLLLLLLLLLLVVRHGRRAAQPEREAKRIAQDAAKPAPERDVDDEVRRRVDDQQQLADDVESDEVVRIFQTVLEVALRERHLSTSARD